MDNTLTTLLTDIRRQGSIPSSAATGSLDADLIGYINDQLIGIIAEVIKCREGFNRYYKDHTLTSSKRYRIPTRAIGNRLDAVLLLDGGGKVVRKLDELAYGSVPSFTYVTDTMGYHLEAGDIVLTPVSTTGAVTLRMVYYCRPPQVSSSLDTAAGHCFTITGVSGNVLTITASHGILTSTKIDILKAGPPHEYLTIDELPSAVASTTVTVADGSRVEVGDFVCLADKAPVVQIPDAFRPPLLLQVAQRYWEALDGTDMVERLDMLIWGDGKRNKGAMGRAIALITPRVEEGSKKIMSPYGALGACYGPSRRIQ